MSENKVGFFNVETRDRSNEEKEKLSLTLAMVAVSVESSETSAIVTSNGICAVGVFITFLVSICRGCIDKMWGCGRWKNWMMRNESFNNLWFTLSYLLPCQRHCLISQCKHIHLHLNGRPTLTTWPQPHDRLVFDANTISRCEPQSMFELQYLYWKQATVLRFNSIPSLITSCQRCERWLFRTLPSQVESFTGI